MKVKIFFCNLSSRSRAGIISSRNRQINWEWKMNRGISLALFALVAPMAALADSSPAFNPHARIQVLRTGAPPQIFDVVLAPGGTTTVSAMNDKEYDASATRSQATGECTVVKGKYSFGTDLAVTSAAQPGATGLLLQIDFKQEDVVNMQRFKIGGCEIEQPQMVLVSSRPSFAARNGVEESALVEGSGKESVEIHVKVTW